jgi:hypothetical protein
MIDNWGGRRITRRRGKSNIKNQTAKFPERNAIMEPQMNADER